ncbi:hypothetical protein OIU77_031002 [Salix suchowensis]|uniref:Uncharacterized protein n=1 Tax=Salix suchowensis TaxID=1278906 RepID=A0ABQ9BDW6_9ROSI|nr:hypothetical protein OIU77_031002 [Salix suchowensis]
MTRASACRDALKSFIQGYQKVFSRKTTICEYSSRCSVEGCDFFLSYSFLGQWAYYQSFHYASVGAGTVYYDSATNLGSNAEDHGSAEALKKLLLNISNRLLQSTKRWTISLAEVNGYLN